MNNQQYFYRTAIFSRQEGQIALVDVDQPDKRTPLEPWMGTVFSLADGHHTIQQLISYLSGQYQTVPDNLEETVASVIERLQEGKLLQLSDRIVQLPYYLASPIEELEQAKAKKLMLEDGYANL